MIVPMKELSGNEASDATGFRSGRLPQHSSPDAQIISGTADRPTDKKTSSALSSPLTPALIRSPAEWRPVELAPAYPAYPFHSAGANVCTRKARLPRSSIKISFRFRCTAIRAGQRNFISNHSVRPEVAPEGGRRPRPSGSHSTNFDQCREIRGTLDGYGSGRHGNNRRHFHSSTTPPPGLAWR
jgi:hypothetical protein